MQLQVEISSISSYVLLGYLSNRDQKFFSYVTAWVSVITNISVASQWTYIESRASPTDIATKRHFPSQLLFSGPRFLKDDQFPTRLIPTIPTCLLELVIKVSIKITTAGRGIHNHSIVYTRRFLFNRVLFFLGRWCRGKHSSLEDSLPEAEERFLRNDQQ